MVRAAPRDAQRMTARLAVRLSEEEVTKVKLVAVPGPSQGLSGNLWDRWGKSWFELVSLRKVMTRIHDWWSYFIRGS